MKKCTLIRNMNRDMTVENDAGAGSDNNSNINNVSNNSDNSDKADDSRNKSSLCDDFSAHEEIDDVVLLVGEEIMGDNGSMDMQEFIRARINARLAEQQSGNPPQEAEVKSNFPWWIPVGVLGVICAIGAGFYIWDKYDYNHNIFPERAALESSINQWTHSANQEKYDDFLRSNCANIRDSREFISQDDFHKLMHDFNSRYEHMIVKDIHEVTVHGHEASAQVEWMYRSEHSHAPSHTFTYSSPVDFRQERGQWKVCSIDIHAVFSQGN